MKTEKKTQLMKTEAHADTHDFPTEQIPPSFHVCFLADCPRADDCIRHLAGLHTAEGVTLGPAVYPSALTADGCHHFKQTRIMHGAWGFNALFADIKQKHSSLLRRQIETYLGGHGTYYRYHNGERLLTPEQQEWIISLFREYGYDEDLHFDGYRDAYDFT